MCRRDFIISQIECMLPLICTKWAFVSKRSWNSQARKHHSLYNLPDQSKTMVDQMNSIRKYGRQLRRTYWGDVIYRWMKFSPVLFYGFLALYCIISAIAGSQSISRIAVLPYVYSFLAPGILLAVLLAVRIVALIFYRDQRFRSNGCTSIIAIFIAIGLAYLPNIAGLYDSILGDFSFQWVDFVLITLSLWEIAVRVLFSVHQQKREVELALGWLEQLTDVAITSVIYQLVPMLFLGQGLLIYQKGLRVLDRQDPKLGLYWLAVGYLSFGLIRWYMVDSELGGLKPRYPRDSKKGKMFIQRRLKALGIGGKNRSFEGENEPENGSEGQPSSG